MDHVAIMNPKWKLIEKILSGKKTIESRWHKTKRAPWGKVKKGDTIYFKNSGEPIEAKASIYQVKQYILTLRHSENNVLESEESQEQNTIIDQNPNEIYQKYGKDIGLNKSEFKKAILDKNNKKYCILLWLKDPRKWSPTSRSWWLLHSLRKGGTLPKRTPPTFGVPSLLTSPGRSMERSRRRVKPFKIDKTGFGIASAWITLEDVNKIRISQHK